MTISLGGAATRFTQLTTVVSTPADHSLTTLQVVKDELKLTGTDAALDAVLTRYINEASRAIENFCNRVFVVETIKDRFFPQRDPAPNTVLGGLDPLQLSKWPVVAVSSMKEDSVALTQDTDFYVDAERGQLVRLDGGGYPRRWDAFPQEVQYTAGYATIPADISAAAIRMVVARYFYRIRDPLVKSETIEGVASISYIMPGKADGNMTADVIDLLENYRVNVVA